MKKISLSKGEYAIVDDEDFEWLSQQRWHITSNRYARRIKWDGKKKKNIYFYMHREILQRYGFGMKGKETDHINRNKLDNRKVNFRIATHQQNGFNSSLSKRNKSGYKGVSWDKERKVWATCIGIDNKCLSLGRFITPQEAAIAYNNAALKYHVEFARLNNV